MRNALVVAVFLGVVWRGVAGEPAGQTVGVVIVHDPGAVKGLDPVSERVRGMLRLGVTALTGVSDPAEAWRRLLASNDVVGIKVNCSGAPSRRPDPVLVEGIVEGAMSAGVAATNIVVWDRDPGKVVAAGYHFAASGVRQAAILQDTGWDTNVFYESKLVGRLIWGDLFFGRADRSLSTRSHLPALVARVTRLINVALLGNHESYGIAGALENLSVTMVDNNRRFESGNPEIAEIVAMPVIRDKLVLNVMDGLVGVYAGGPAYRVAYAWPAARLLLGRQPATVDSAALELIEQQRHAAKLPTVGNAAGHVATAARLGLGTTNLTGVVREVRPEVRP
jgi:hypothetical protein